MMVPMPLRRAAARTKPTRRHRLCLLGTPHEPRVYGRWSGYSRARQFGVKTSTGCPCTRESASRAGGLIRRNRADRTDRARLYSTRRVILRSDRWPCVLGAAPAPKSTGEDCLQISTFMLTFWFD